MTYPPLPTDKQYGSWFPSISTRGVPSPDGPLTIDDNPLSLQPQSQSTSETLSAPKKIEFGVLRLWVEGGGKQSTSYDDGPEFDRAEHGMKSSSSSEFALCFAPAVDEKALALRWQVYGLEHIRSAKLELFCRGHKEAIWSFHWGDAWERADAEISAFPAQVSGEHTDTGSFPFTTITPDDSLVLPDATGKSEAKAFPDKLLTLARSPYQLRLTVSGCTAKDTPKDGDKFAYPGVAWTYLHVAVHSFSYRFGPHAWLSTTRDDIDEAFRAQIVGSREAEDYGLEGQALTALVERAPERWGPKTRHRVALTCNLNIKRLRVRHETGPAIEDAELYAKMWGLGARVPIVATPRIHSLSGDPSTTKVAEIVRGARLIWDWGSDDPDAWQQATSTPDNEGRGALSRDFLAKLAATSKALAPPGSTNCTKARGGKLGDDDAPVFLAQSKAGDGKGSLPFEVLALSKRKWAVSSSFDEAGESGVMFQPARLAGDHYKVTTYLHVDDSLDTPNALNEVQTASGSPGVFEVYRKLDVHHVVVGSLGSLNPKTMIDAAVSHARKQIALELAVTTTTLGASTYQALMSEAVRRLGADPAGYYTFFGLEIPRIVKLDRLGAALIAVEDHASFTDSVQTLFREGTMRLVRLAGTTPAERSEAFTVNGVAHVPVYLDERIGTQQVYYVLTGRDDPPVATGDNAVGVCTTTARTLTLESDARSCWEYLVELSKDTREHGKALVVNFPGPRSTTISFPRAGRSISTVLSTAAQTSLRDTMLASVTGLQSELRRFRVTIEGDNGTANGKARVKAVQSFIDGLVENERILLIRRRAFERYKERSPFWRLRIQSGAPSSYANNLGKPGSQTLYNNLYTHFANAFVEDAELDAGVVVVHSGRATTFTTTDARIASRYNTRKNAWIDASDYPTGAASDGAFKELEGREDLSLVYLITPDASWPSFLSSYTGRLKQAWAIFLHEIGHSLALNHAPLAPGREGQPKPGSGTMAEEHLAKESCIMSYDSKSNQFCALCMLRIRGWKWKDLREISPYELDLSFHIADLDLPFGNRVDADVVRTLQTRLQVLGLFNRPLELRADPHFTQEFDEAWAYSLELAKTLLPGLADTPEAVLEEALRNYMFEGGKLPGPKEQAKLRLWGHLHPLYANMDLALRYGNPTLKNSKENAFKMMAVLGDINALVQTQNPAIGAYPIELHLSDDAGEALADTPVYIDLIPPHNVQGRYKTDASGAALVGGTSYVEGTAAPALHEQVKKYFDTHIDGHEPSDSADPQAKNVHADLGGKRGIYDDGDVVSPREADGLRNIFSSSIRSKPYLRKRDDWGWDSFVEPLPATKPGTEQAMKHTALVTTDEFGVATFLFTPSTIGGDRYRLRARVYDPKDPEHVLAEVETGDMTIWRTYRIGGYHQMPNVASEDELSASQKFLRRRDPSTGDKLMFAKLLPLQLRSGVADELARAYGEVIFDEGALEPKALDKTYWRSFATATRDLLRRYPDIEQHHLNFWKTSFTLPLDVDPRDPLLYTTTIPVPFVRGHLGFTTDIPYKMQADNVGAHDYDAKDDGSADEMPILALAQGDFAFGLSKGKGARDNAWEFAGKALPIATGSKVNYNTRRVTIRLRSSLAPHFKVRKVDDTMDRRLCSADQLTITGATIANTDSGIVHVRLRKHRNREGRFDVHAYKHIDEQEGDLVAAAIDVRSGRDYTLRARNGSGLRVQFRLGDGPSAGLATFDTGIPRLHVRYNPMQIVDPTAALEPVERGPWLLNYRSPDEYNSRKGANFVAAPPGATTINKLTQWEDIAGGKTDFGWAETIFLRALTGCLANGQSLSFYPGQLYIQANIMNGLQGTGLGGKGTGNTAFIFNRGSQDPKMLHYLLLHETGHCLYGVHANKEGGFKASFHDSDDMHFACIMGGAELGKGGRSSLEGFCGKCLAGLRGILVMEEPLYSASLAKGQIHDVWRDKDSGALMTGRPKSGAVPPGDSKAIRRAATGGFYRATSLAPIDDFDIHPLPVHSSGTEEIELLAPPGPPETLTDKTCEMIFYPQEKSNWCWAAASQMMRKRYNNETIRQCKLVSDALFDPDTIDCCHSGNDSVCNQQHSLALIDLEYVGSGEGNALDFDTIKTEIDANRPFIFAKRHHYLICSGYTEGTSTQELHVYDPLPVGVGNTSRMSYADYKHYVEDGGDNYFEFSGSV